MRLNLEPVSITEDDATIRAALEAVEPVPLLAAVAALTGDLSILHDDLRPDAASFDPTAGLSPEQMTTARDLAAAALARYRDEGCEARPVSAPAVMRRILEFLAGGEIEDDYVAVMTEELALNGTDLRAPQWCTHTHAHARAHTPMHMHAEA